ECAHAPKNLARDFSVAFPLLAVRHHFLLNEATDLLAQHPQLFGQAGRVGELKLRLYGRAGIAAHDIHRGLSASRRRWRRRNAAISATAVVASGISGNIWNTWIIPSKTCSSASTPAAFALAASMVASSRTVSRSPAWISSGGRPVRSA